MSRADTKTHDYRDGHRHWGHDISYRPTGERGERLAATGWGSGISAGDYILLSARDSDTRYRFDDITYYADPPDMWRATLEFAPRYHPSAA